MIDEGAVRITLTRNNHSCRDTWGGASLVSTDLLLELGDNIQCTEQQSISLFQLPWNEGTSYLKDENCTKAERLACQGMNPPSTHDRRSAPSAGAQADRERNSDSHVYASISI